KKQTSHRLISCNAYFLLLIGRKTQEGFFLNQNIKLFRIILTINLLLLFYYILLKLFLFNIKVLFFLFKFLFPFVLAAFIIFFLWVNYYCQLLLPPSLVIYCNHLSLI